MASSPRRPQMEADRPHAVHPLWGLVTVLATIAERVERSRVAEQSANAFDVSAEELGGPERPA